MSLQADIGYWHRRRFPDATIEQVGLKLAEEAGEVAEAINAVIGGNSSRTAKKSDIIEEAADVVIVAMVLLERFAQADLLDAVSVKFAVLTDPNGGHPAALAI